MNEKDTYAILFVDDEREICKEFSEYVSRTTSHRIDLAYNGLEALEKLEKNHFDAVVLDLKMPQMDGEKAFARIKKEYPKVAVVILTAYGDINRASRMVREGAYDFIAKGSISMDYILLQAIKGIKEKSYDELKVFVKGAAHQFKNSSYRVTVELSLLEDVIQGNKFSSDVSEKMLRHINSLKEEASHGLYIALRMKGIDENTTVKKAEVRIKEFVERFIRYFSKQGINKIPIIQGENLIVDIDPSVSPTTTMSIDSHHIMETFIDIVDNAFDAIMQREIANGMVNISVKKSEGGFLFSFIDNGCGISEENKKFIFTPFFTTKGADGCGLGMLYAQCVVNKHGGQLNIDSVVGKGTTVTIFIPDGDCKS